MKKTRLSALLLAGALFAGSMATVCLSGCELKKPDNDDPGVVKPVKQLTGIELDVSKAKTTFAYGEEFSYEGLKVLAVYDDGTKEEVDLSECKVTKPNMGKEGTRVVAVTYEHKTARYEITIEARKLPEVSQTSLLDITEANSSAINTVEAEAIDMAATQAQKADGVDSFVGTAEAEAGVSDGKYLTGFGVNYNYFGFSFTADKEYKDSTLVFRMAYSGAEAELDITKCMNVYLNRAEDEEGVVTGKLELFKTLYKESEEWVDVVVRNVTIAKGHNEITFDMIASDAPDIDCIEFYTGARYINSTIALTEAGKKVMKDLETFDTEFAITEESWANANPDKIVNGLGVEPVKNAEAKENTSNGTSIAALMPGSALSTTIDLAQPATVNMTMIATAIDPYWLTEYWAFYIDGVKLQNVEPLNIGTSSSRNYWNWAETNLGSYNLDAGKHFFEIKCLGGTSLNIDGINFTAVSLGSYDDSGIALDQQTKKEFTQIDANKPSYRYEAEQAALTGSQIHNRENNGQAVGGIEASKGGTITFVINAETAGEAVLSMNLAMYRMALIPTAFTVTLNGQTVENEHAGFVAIDKNYGGTWFDYTLVTFGKINLQQGENVLVLTIGEGARCNFDYLHLNTDVVLDGTLIVED